MNEKNYSQKVAGAFEVVSLLLLLPAAVGLFYGFLLILVGVKSGAAATVLIGLIPFAAAGVGVTLLVGYHQHARGRLAEKRVSALWTATVVFNFLLALPWLFGFISFILSSVGAPRAGFGREAIYLSGAVLYVYGALIYYAQKAAASE